MAPELETLTDIDFLKKHKLDSRFKNLDEAMAYIAEAEKALKERDGYKKQRAELDAWAKQNGFNNFKEMQEAAVASRKSSADSNGGGQLRTKIAEHHKRLYANEKDERGQPLQPDPRMFEFLEAVLQEALGGVKNYDKQMEKILDALDESFDHRQELSYLLSLPEAERAKIKPMLGDIRNVYKTQELWKKPDDADDTYDPFAVAYQRHIEALKRAGAILPGDEKTETKAPARRIAFTGSPKAAPSDEGRRRTKAEAMEDAPELYNPDGTVKWEEALGISEAPEGEEE